MDTSCIISCSDYDKCEWVYWRPWLGIYIWNGSGDGKYYGSVSSMLCLEHYYPCFLSDESDICL